jgi:3-hydroxyisobutyrate dehydrogenase
MRIVERMDESQPELVLQPPCVGISLVVRLALEHDLAADAFGLHDLNRRGGPGHDDGDRNPEPGAVIAEPLRVIAGRGRDHPAVPPLAAEQQQRVERAPLLVGGGELVVLELQPDLGAADLGQRAAVEGGGADHRAGDPLGRGTDIGDGQRGAGGIGPERGLGHFAAGARATRRRCKTASPAAPPGRSRLVRSAKAGKQLRMSEAVNVSFLGLGVMGGPMARHLAKAGHRLTVYNRSPRRLEQWQEANPGLAARTAATPAEAAEGADAVLTCVGNDDDLADVVLGPHGVFSTLRQGGVFIDHTTVSARIARQIAVEARDKLILSVDAPVTGSQAGAENGTLSIMCGGSAKAVEAARPVMSAYAKRVTHVGKSGAGQSTKMVNQICIAAIVAGLSEAVRFAQGARLDMAKVYEAISGGAAQSWQMDNRWATMDEGRFDFGFAIDWMRKDLGLAIDEARSIGVAVPVAALVDQFFSEVQALGGGREDTSALVRRLPRKGAG